MQYDDTLWSHAGHFKYRWELYKSVRSAIENNEGGFDEFTKKRGYEFFGLHRGEHD